MGKTFIGIILLLLSITFHQSCKKKSSNSLPKLSDDTCGYCKAFSIDADRFEHFLKQDTLMLNYDSGENVVFKRGNKDTLLFSVLDKKMEVQKGIISPCFCYFNYFDYLHESFKNQEGVTLSVTWNVSNFGPNKKYDYPNYHNITINFNDIDFKFYTSPFVKDSTYIISSTTLKTYTCTFRNGKITKFVTQGGIEWEVLN